MLILFDHAAPTGVSHALRPHTVVTAKASGWEQLSNGALLKVAEEAAFDLLFTTDGNLRFQQNLTGRKIALVGLTGTTKWSRVRLHLERIVATMIQLRRVAMPRWKFRSSKPLGSPPN
jgi:hypothetical protein